MYLAVRNEEDVQDDVWKCYEVRHTRSLFFRKSSRAPNSRESHHVLLILEKVITCSSFRESYHVLLILEKVITGQQAIRKA